MGETEGCANGTEEEKPYEHWWGTSGRKSPYLYGNRCNKSHTYPTLAFLKKWMEGKGRKYNEERHAFG